ncbi:MATE efflux family protein [Enterobacter cloacae]|uniref:MATE efflux family protein n=1 Tax=Enterobacter cloacae TaxID=550 RepID=A0A377LYQ8_ENTCL|nr:MATE efflux family protein [Enterobacter cloacae]
MGTDVIAGNFIAFSIASLINLPGNALGSASTIITGKRLGKGQIGQAERQLRHVFWLSTIGLTIIAWGSAPFAGLMASFYTHEDDVKEVVKILIWLNAAFMPIWAASLGTASRVKRGTRCPLCDVGLYARMWVAAW